GSYTIRTLFRSIACLCQAPGATSAAAECAVTAEKVGALAMELASLAGLAAPARVAYRQYYAAVPGAGNWCVSGGACFRPYQPVVCGEELGTKCTYLPGALPPGSRRSVPPDRS